MKAQNELDKACRMIESYALPGTKNVVRSWLKVVISAAQLVWVERELQRIGKGST